MLKNYTMEPNFHAKLLPPRKSAIQEVVGYAAFQALALTLDASKTGSNDSEMGSISPLTRLNAMITLKVTMVLKPYSYVTCFQAGDTMSKLIGSIYKAPQLDMIVYTEILGRILTMKNKLYTNPRLSCLDILLSTDLGRDSSFYDYRN